SMLITNRKKSMNPLDNNQIFDRIRHDISNNDVVVYMKGSAAMPKDGFSAAVVQILDSLGLTYVDVDVLADEALHQAVKEFTNWPSTPQVYVKGEFVGGCDIIRDMNSSGKLQELLRQHHLIG